MGFKEFINSKNTLIKTLKLTDDFVTEFIEPAIKGSKMIRSKKLLFCPKNTLTYMGPGVSISNTLNESEIDTLTVNSPISTHRIKEQVQSPLVFVPNDMFKAYQRNGTDYEKTLDEISENVIIDIQNYMLLDLTNVYEYARMSRFNKFKNINELKTYNDLITLLNTYKRYYMYRKG